MKKLLFAGLLAALGITAALGWRLWHNLGKQSPLTVAGVTAGAGGPGAAATAGAQARPTASAGSSNLPAGNPVPAATATAVAAAPPKRAWDYNYFASLTNAASGAAIRFELVGGAFATGTIQYVERTNGEIILVAGEVSAPEVGRFSFRKQTLPGKAGDYSGEVIFPASKRAFRIEPTGAGGKSELVARRLDEVICLALPAVDPALADINAPEEMPPLRPDQVPDYVPPYNEGIISLQSLPGATGVLYMDYRGGYTPTWGGITYAKPNASNAQIKDVWKRVAEDFLPFNINVTTDIRVYQAAPENSRQRCVLTPTTTAAPGAGGVAYMNDWNSTGDRPCWSFYSTGKDAAEVVSHEVGHTLGLAHDGRTTPAEGYFGGQGSGVTGWAPIMGVGYYQPVAQWSKGEYAYANQTQDDLGIIVNNNSVDYRADDTGATLATARYLETYPNGTAFAEGVIETTGDTDAFRFTIGGGAISLTASPVGDWADLALSATLADASDTVITSNNPQNVLTASIATNLPAGTYTFRVTGAGRNDPLTDGFSSYASLGYYAISGSVAAAMLPTRFSLAENSTNGTGVGTVTATNLGVDALRYTILSGNTSNTFALDNNGGLTVANAATLDYEALAKNTQLAVQFELFVNITNTTNPALTELNRRVLVVITNVNEAPSVTGFTNTLIAHTQSGTIVGTVAATDPDAYSVLTLSIVGGNSNAVFALDNATGNLIVAGDPDASGQSVFNLAIQVADNGSPVLKATNYAQITLITNASPFQPGTISYAVYDNIGSGVYVSNLTSNARFPTDPTWEKPMLAAEGESDRADNCGSVLRGYLIPPVSGNYTFYIATDDNGELWMSTTTNPASMTKIANITGSGSWASARQWDKYTSQKSTTRSLVAGQAYCLEARQKEGGGGDNLAIGWSGPANSGRTNVIPALYLAPYFVNYVPHAAGFTNYVRRGTFPNARLGQVIVTDVNTNDTRTFAILSGNAAGIFSVDANGWISVANDAALAATAATNFTLTVQTTDNGTPPLSGTTTVGLNVVAAGGIAPTQIQREVFNDLGGGTAISDLTSNARFPGQPDALVALTNFASPADVADNYGSRIRALLVPSVSGDYQFFIASDDSSQLKFSRDTNAANAVVIASVSGWTSPNGWNDYPSQTSALITNLVAGQSYYLEALHKEGGGGDHVEVAWLVPGSGVTNVIPGANLSPVDLNYPPQFNSQALALQQNVTNGAAVTTVPASDSALDTLTFQLGGGNTSNTFALDPITGKLTVADNTLIANGVVAGFTLTIIVQDSGYGGLYPLRTSTNTLNFTIPGTNSFVWDANGAAPGAQDGNGNWGSSSATWWNGSTNTVWTDNIAVFGAGTTTNCTVTLTNDVMPYALAFNTNAGGAYTLAGANSIWLNVPGTPLNVTANGNATISVPLRGNNALVKLGAGTLTLTAASHYAGATLVSEGILKLGTNTAFGSGLVATNAGTLDLNGRDFTASMFGLPLTVGGTGMGGMVVTNSATARAQFQDLELATDATLGGANTLFIGGTNAANGVLNLNGHTLTKAGNGALVLNGMSLTGAGNITVNAGSLQLMDNYSGGNQQDTALTGSGNLTINAGATVTTYRWNPTLTLSMPVVMNGGTLGSSWPGPNGATYACPMLVNSNSTINLNGGGYGNATFSGHITGNGGLTVTGDSQTRMFTGTNSYGWTTISTGVLQIGNGGTGGTLGLGPVTNNATLTFNRSDALSVSNRIFGSGALTQSGVGSLNLSGTNVYTGSTTLAAGILNVSAPETPGASGPLGKSGKLIFTGGILQYSGLNSFDYSPRFSTATNQSFKIDTAGQSVTFAAALTSTNGGNLTKLGAGTLTLAGSNTYDGPTVIAAGTLRVNGSIATGAVTVAANAVLGGTGVITGATTVQNGGWLAPGNGGMGTLTINNNLLLAGQTWLGLSKDGGVATNSLVLVAGTLTQGGSLVVTNLGINTLMAGDSFKLFTAGGWSGTFTNLILPPLTNGLSWNVTMLPTNGTVAVVANVRPPVIVPGLSVSNANLNFQFTGTIGQHYRVEFAPALPASGTWQVLTDIVSLAASPFTVMDAITNAQRFYRVSVIP